MVSGAICTVLSAPLLQIFSLRFLIMIGECRYSQAANGQLISSFTNVTIPPLFSSEGTEQIAVGPCNASNSSMHWRFDSLDKTQSYGAVVSSADGKCLDGSFIQSCQEGTMVSTNVNNTAPETVHR